MHHAPNFDHVDHFRIALRPADFKALLPKLERILKRYDFDAIAFMGNSGALLAAPIAMHMKKTLIMVRTTRGVHSSRLVEGDRAVQRYIIVDDLIATGKTARLIKDRIHSWHSPAECLGVLEVNEVDNGNEEDLSPIPGECV